MTAAPLYTTRIPVRWGDMDALGHVNNTAYLIYVEQARIECLERLPGSPWPGTDAEGPLLVSVEMTYRKPVRYPATVRVEVQADGVGRTSFALLNRLTVEGDTATLYAEARTVLVWVDHATGRPTPVPPAMREALLDAAGRRPSGSRVA